MPMQKNFKLNVGSRIYAYIYIHIYAYLNFIKRSLYQSSHPWAKPIRIYSYHCQLEPGLVLTENFVQAQHNFSSANILSNSGLVFWFILESGCSGLQGPSCTPTNQLILKLKTLPDVN